MQLVFGRDAILNTKFEANWKYIKERKQKMIERNNIKENKNRIPYTYSENEKVLMKNPTKSKFGEPAFLGPYTIRKINNNGT
jgi:hypothetical protein